MCVCGISLIILLVVLGGDFLLEAIKVKDQLRCYFAVTDNGLPLRLQRKPYTECFYIMGLYELYRATSELKYQVLFVCLSVYHHH